MLGDTVRCASWVDSRDVTERTQPFDVFRLRWLTERACSRWDRELAPRSAFVDRLLRAIVTAGEGGQQEQAGHDAHGARNHDCTVAVAPATSRFGLRPLTPLGWCHFVAH